LVFELGSFFQNFRRYVRSYDPNRMHDGADSGSPVSACQPFSYLGGNGSLPINPCGQIANNFFNDTFRVLGPGGELEVDDSSIAWSSDADHLYGPVAAVNYNPADAAALRGGNTTFQVLNQNQHWMVRWQGCRHVARGWHRSYAACAGRLCARPESEGTDLGCFSCCTPFPQVWMRPHSQVAVQKLYGQINTPIEAGTQLTIEVQNRYNTYEYAGAKTRESGRLCIPVLRGKGAAQHACGCSDAGTAQMRAQMRVLSPAPPPRTKQPCCPSHCSCSHPHHQQLGGWAQQLPGRVLHRCGGPLPHRVPLLCGRLRHWWVLTVPILRLGARLAVV
jgi:hypothetical protein